MNDHSPERPCSLVKCSLRVFALTITGRDLNPAQPSASVSRPGAAFSWPKEDCTAVVATFAARRNPAGVGQDWNRTSVQPFRASHLTIPLCLLRAELIQAAQSRCAWRASYPVDGWSSEATY